MHDGPKREQLARKTNSIHDAPTDVLLAVASKLGCEVSRRFLHLQDLHNVMRTSVSNDADAHKVQSGLSTICLDLFSLAKRVRRGSRMQHVVDYDEYPNQWSELITKPISSTIDYDVINFRVVFATEIEKGSQSFLSIII